MAPRAHWRGFLKLSFVSCPVALYPAIAAEERLSFRRVNRRTGNRLRHQLVDEITGETVQPDQSGRGYQVGDNRFLIVEDAELKAAEQEARERPFTASRSSSRQDSDVPAATARTDMRQMPAPSSVTQRRPDNAPQQERGPEPEAPPEPELLISQPAKIENNRTIEIDRFVLSEEVDLSYLQTPYYIAPRGEVGEEAFAVIRDAMRGKNVIAMGRVVLARRERPLVIEPFGRGLRAITLRFAHEIRNPADYFEPIPEVRLPQEMLRIAEHIVAAKTGSFDIGYLEDRYRTAVLSKLKEKHMESAPQPSVVAPSQENIINLLDALKRSLGTQKVPPEPSASRRGKFSKGERRRSGRDRRG